MESPVSIAHIVVGIVLLLLSIRSGFFIIVAVPYFFALAPFGMEKASGLMEGYGILFYCLIGLTLSFVIARKKLIGFGNRKQSKVKPTGHIGLSP